MSVSVRGLSFSYGDREVLKAVDLNAEAGQVLSILGPNGVGKSTLFRCILGLLREYSGEIAVQGRDTRSLSPRELSRLVAYIPQSSGSAFNYSVFDIVLMGTTSTLGAFSTPGRMENDRAAWALDKMGISHLRDRCFHRISGGERQLAMIARALAQNARVLMLDEPTASLDFGNQLRVLAQARALAAEGYTVIQTTHDPERTYLYSDRVLALKDGSVLTEGPPRQVLNPELMRALYGVDVQVSSLFEDRVRVCTPRDLLG